MRKFSVLIMAALFVMALPAVLLADSIDPSSLTRDLAVGESITITKTVTVDAEPPEEAPVDVFFLTDSTGSMYYAINQVKASASDILADTAGLGDMAYGVGEYRDVGDYFVYRTNQDITTDTAAVQAGINAWSAGGGGDWEEANIFALHQVATTVSWRDGSTRILCWFGDAPGHDPSGPYPGVTEAEATAALVDNDISVEAIDMAYLDYYGQATRITAATGGHYYPGVSSSEIVEVIEDSIETAINEYGEVTLSPEGLDLVAVSWTPGAYVGDYDRSVAQTFEFEVTFECTGPGVDSFMIHALVDGGRVATETDTFNQGEPIPEPSTILLLGSGLFGFGLLSRKRKK